MEQLKGACIIGQSGGPTSVINASAQGVIQTALKLPPDHPGPGRGPRHQGGAGRTSSTTWARRTPPSWTCSSIPPPPPWAPAAISWPTRTQDDTDYRRILEIFQKYDVRYFFYNGGNDSMDTCNKISKYMQKVGYACNIIGVPKTIDNDLSGTDHCPGYGSAAKYIATSCMELYQDARVYDTGTVVIVEIMGRHAGWLAGAAGLATWAGAGPDLVYLPEVDFDMDQFLADVKKVYEETGNCLVAVSEGIHYADGTFVSEAKTSATDGFGHAQLGGLAALLADRVKQALGVKVRGIELSLLQRCGAHLASQTDIREAYAAGKAAVEAAVAGQTDQMVALDCTRDETGYRCRTKLVPLTQAANTERKVPRDWINQAGNGICQPFIHYALPLIQGEPERPLEGSLPKFAKLKKVLTTDRD